MHSVRGCTRPPAPRGARRPATTTTIPSTSGKRLIHSSHHPPTRAPKPQRRVHQPVRRARPDRVRGHDALPEGHRRHRHRAPPRVARGTRTREGTPPRRFGRYSVFSIRPQKRLGPRLEVEVESSAPTRAAPAAHHANSTTTHPSMYPRCPPPAGDPTSVPYLLPRTLPRSRGAS